MCTHTRTGTGTGAVRRVRGLRVRPFSMTPRDVGTGSRTLSSEDVWVYVRVF